MTQTDNQNNAPVVSLLMPFYNVDKYVGQSVQSASAQSLRDIEIICLNDGSTDNSREIVGQLAAKDSRITIIDKANSGYGATMNVGLKAAQGHYIAILETDDILEPDALELMVEAAQKYDAQVVKTNYSMYWTVPDERREFVELITPSMANRIIDPQLERQIFFNPPAIWTGLYRRDFLEQNQIDFLETPGASYQDTAFNFKVWVSASRAIFLTNSILLYRQDNESSSVNSKGKMFFVCDEYAEMRRYLDQRPDKKASLIALNTKMKYNTYAWNLWRLEDVNKLRFLKRMAQEFREDQTNGYLDFELFEDYKTEDLQAIMASPEDYFISICQGFDGSILQKIGFYKAVGGFSLVVKVMKQRLFG